MSVRNCLKVIGNTLMGMEMKTYNHQKIIFSGCNNIPLSICNNVPKFPNAHTVAFDNCDKNTVDYWLHCELYPNVRQVILNSDTSEYDIFNRFMRKSNPEYFNTDARAFENTNNIKLVLNKNYENVGYKKEWFESSDIDWTVVSNEEIMKMIDEMEFNNGEHNCDVIDYLEHPMMI